MLARVVVTCFEHTVESGVAFLGQLGHELVEQGTTLHSHELRHLFEDRTERPVMVEVG